MTGKTEGSGLARIRPAGVEDVPGILAIYTPIVRETHISFELEPPTLESMRERVFPSRSRDPSRRYPWLVAESDGRVAGYASASAFRTRPAYRWSVEVSVYVAEGFRGRGFARGLYEALFEILRMQRFHRAFAGIALPNPGSVALHRAFGFTSVGVLREVGFKLDQWWDVSWWERPVGETLASPAEPLPFSDIVNRPECVAILNGGAVESD